MPQGHCLILSGSFSRLTGEQRDRGTDGHVKHIAILTWVREEVPTLGEWLMGSLERGRHHIFMFIERDAAYRSPAKAYLVH